MEAGDVVCAGDATVEGQGIVGGEVALGQGQGFSITKSWAMVNHHQTVYVLWRYRI